MRRSVSILLAAGPALLTAIAVAVTPSWSAALSGALAGLVTAALAATASSCADSPSSVGAVGWRLAAVLVRMVGVAGGMALLVERSAVVALLIGVAAGWMVEMTLWTLRLAQERKIARV
jgi:hypothetical protein